MQGKSGHVARFMPCFDGPFKITAAHPEKLCYTLELPNKPLQFPTFHFSLLPAFVLDNDKLIPSQKLPQPGPVITPDGEEEWVIKKIIDEWPQGQGKQYLVHWLGWDSEEDQWLACREVAEMEVLGLKILKLGRV